VEYQEGMPEECYMRNKKKKLTSIERDLVEGLEGFLDDLTSDADIETKYTCRRMVLDLEPVPYSAAQVKATRKLLRISQALFAKFLGVATNTVRAWEQNKANPQDIACRFMDEIQRNPDYYRKRIAQSAKMRECKA
jgi:putative transcriptional regulator